MVDGETAGETEGECAAGGDGGEEVKSGVGAV